MRDLNTSLFLGFVLSLAFQSCVQKKGSQEATKDMANYLDEQEKINSAGGAGSSVSQTAPTTTVLLDVLNNHDASVFNAKPGTVPFSFKYGSSYFSKAWTYLGSTPDGLNWGWRDPSGTLEVTVHTQHYADFGAVKWYLTFTNVGSRDSAPVNTLDVANLGFISAQGRVEQHVLDFSIGATEEGSDLRNLVSDFTPVKVPIGASGGPVNLSSSRGRSSSGTMPYFHIQKPGQDGVILAIGWSGQWKASFSVDPTGTNFGFKSGQETFNAQLRPRESVKTPSILVMPYTGASRVTGQNKFRQLMIKSFYPKNSNGTDLTPIVAASNGALGIPWETVTASNVLDEVQGVSNSKLPFNTIWHDAGWTKPINASQDSVLFKRLTDANLLWFSGAGDWTPDATRFPRGFTPISDLSHGLGMKTLLWFEPERVAKPSQDYTDYAQNNYLLPYPTKRPIGDVAGDETVKQLVDFSNTSVVDMMISKIVSRLTTGRIDFFRQDMNINSINEYWFFNDSKQSSRMGGISRSGMTEASYISGLYRFWDGLRARVPNLVIDNCASGGRRLDIEALSRTVALWRSDRVWEPNQQQDEMLGLSYWLPYQGRGSENSGDVEQLRYKIRSGYGWFGGYAFNWINLAPDHRELLKKEIGALFGSSSPLGANKPFVEIFKGDYYPMAHGQKRYNDAATIPSYTLDLNTWAGWQFDRPDLGVGLIQVFRRSGGASATMTFLAQGLVPNTHYMIRDMDSDSYVVKKGSLLMSSGIQISCPSETCARVFTYKRVKPGALVPAIRNVLGL